MNQTLSFTVPGPPVSKPRQVRSDKWKKRPSVVKYRQWADAVRAVANRAVAQRFPGLILRSYSRMKVVAIFPIPPSWTKVMKVKMQGQPHQQTTDADNILKACSDALFPKYDAQIYDMQVTKYWDDGGGARVEITLY